MLYRYSDRVRIHAPSGNLTVPLHAYPIMNENIFPTKINLPSCELGHKVTKKVIMKNKVPMEFEYELTTITPHPDFDISPAVGKVPPNGQVEVLITFEPSRMATVTFEVLVGISQYAFEPFICKFQPLKTNNPTPHLDICMYVLTYTRQTKKLKLFLNFSFFF